MIGIDTNILVRYITQDDAKQAALAGEVIEKFTSQQNALFINNVVLCELVWVLERGYKYTRRDIAIALQHILTTDEFSFENHEALWLALMDYEKYNCDYSDALIGKTNAQYGCKITLSFDQGTSPLKEFQSIRN